MEDFSDIVNGFTQIDGRIYERDLDGSKWEIRWKYSTEFNGWRITMTQLTKPTKPRSSRTS